eukprot:TRINITY_DN18578_c0_g1_i1.p1 TRINITY_DN18578_c0_g1~~TRINITY_DN18578_c0_g1_i1.p1  ORF type:complete len:219 (+),score=57.12 TRINITY_DN18578_c0_g1_i1:71-727(+)
MADNGSDAAAAAVAAPEARGESPESHRPPDLSELKAAEGKSCRRLPGEARKVPPADLHISWDEANLAEHDKERGTRQKIDEPKTPWASSPVLSDDEDAEDAPEPKEAKEPSVATATFAADLSAKLGAVAQAQAEEPSTPQPQKRPLSPDADDCLVETISMADALKQGPKKSSPAFLAKRAKHYNEFQMLRAFREQQQTKEQPLPADAPAGDAKAATAT